LGHLTLILKKNNLVEKFNTPIQFIYQLKGYFFFNPLIAISFSLSLLSFIGIPPLIGFFGKQLILSSTLEAKKYFLTFLIIVTSTISAIYYLNLIKYTFFIKPKINIIYLNLNIGLNLKDFINNAYLLFINIFYLKRYVNKIIYNNVLFTLSTNISIIIVIITLLSIIYIFIHERCIILINILSLYYI
jgi:NADH-ubiquinone oxidoreductase chain 2